MDYSHYRSLLGQAEYQLFVRWLAAINVDDFHEASVALAEVATRFLAVLEAIMDEIKALGERKELTPEDVFRMWLEAANTPLEKPE